MTFDLGQEMVDVAWSPFKSSVFFCLSQDKVYAYDLEINRHSPITEYRPVKSKCTNITFNWKNPILLVGDSHGGISSFKMAKELGTCRLLYYIYLYYIIMGIFFMKYVLKISV